MYACVDSSSPPRSTFECNLIWMLFSGYWLQFKNAKADNKPSSVPWCFLQGNGHSSREAVTRFFKRPTRELRADHPTYAPLFGLAPGGVYQAPDVTIRPGELLPHRFTLASPVDRENPVRRRSIFCGTFLPVTGTGCYPAPCPVELGLSSRPDTSGPATILSASAYLFTPYPHRYALQSKRSGYRRDIAL